MHTVIQGYLDKVKVGRKQSHRNLAVFPLLSGYATALDYMTLDEALASGLIEVTEVSQGGAVPGLKVVNKSPRLVLILDGEELVGAKQNRIVNTTILIQANSTTVIPVSCVEQGRWHYRSPSFSSEERIMSSALRAMKAEHVGRSVRETGTFRSDQGRIWEEISERADRLAAESPTMAMADLYQKARASLSDYVKHFRPVEMQVGAVFLINGKVVGLESFGRPETFAEVFRKLVESYALDAVDWSEPGGEEKPSGSAVRTFLEAARTSSVESHSSVGLGTDCRMGSERLAGFALVHEEQVLHLSVFARGNGSAKERHGSRMQRRGTSRRTLCSETGGTSMTEMVGKRATYSRTLYWKTGKTSTTVAVAEKGIWRRILCSRREATSTKTRDLGLFSRRQFGWSEPEIHSELTRQKRYIEYTYHAIHWCSEE